MGAEMEVRHYFPVRILFHGFPKQKLGIREGKLNR
jgi:hypothetical protein